MTPQQQAQQWLRDNVLILDTETTGLGEDAEIVEITIIDTTGKVLLDTLVKPSRPIPSEASAIHGITDAMVMGAPEWKVIFPQVDALISGRTVVVYNSAYDARLLDQTIAIHDVLPEIKNGFPKFQCAMLAYAEFYGQKSERGGFKWQKLTAAAEQQGIEIVGTAHRALSDCLTTLGVVNAMAGKSVPRQSVVNLLGELQYAAESAEWDSRAYYAVKNAMEFIGRLELELAQHRSNRREFMSFACAIANSAEFLAKQIKRNEGAV
ncbi:Exodeoxyribonuclease 10 [Serratia ficaria]|uniref:3'-5' exonuclease n=1 Tax=Serratia ficaria TaxID=61651 RepID=UPI002183A23A|nr:3'-5' exonuclease [Serratia ficaria]CAI2488590.1 Exodeoxyribonuclease 10 [Serratia ficaria]CAI2533588.1 Exodeoxyribonuclease 10 [Serratia ficaria]